jgi:hypothetical protein
MAAGQKPKAMGQIGGKMKILRFTTYLVFVILLPTISLAAAQKKHPPVPVDQECSDCHSTQAQVWQDGMHGLMNVKCVVCHDSADKNFIAKTDIYKCRGCHGEQVKDVEDKLPAKARNCFLCHDHHSVKAVFHTKGGKQ